MRKEKKEKLKFFEGRLHDFFRRAGREHLPWRKPGVTAYEVWVSEIMLQQTQVSRVIGYYDRFLNRFPTVERLAATTWEEFLPYYAGLGYYARGRNMLKAASVVVGEYGGKFPKDTDKLVSLPGVGPYTAAAIASFAYGKNTVAWDTNLRRVVGRFFFGSKRADIPFTEFEGAFRMPAKDLNGALMDFGSAICVARPKCGACPLRDRCKYFRNHGKDEMRNVKDALETEIRSNPTPRRLGTPFMKGRDGAGTKKTKTETNSHFAFRISKLSFKDAQVMLFLHEGHRKYYSSRKKGYAPFVVPASHNTRAGIKDWFRNRYGLELAVRPPYRKLSLNGKPTLLVNAQILLGTPTFATSDDAAYRIFVSTLPKA
ncbi:MAG: A/G-specific adenine glycosylase [Candidatus Moranbacteria bacterium]|nr:A/G-specific adenine glycosylase [Candidatus Moranbacteria bacterium]